MNGDFVVVSLVIYGDLKVILYFFMGEMNDDFVVVSLVIYW